LWYNTLSNFHREEEQMTKKNPGPKAKTGVEINGRLRHILKRMLRKRQIAHCLVWRIQIILLAAQGLSNSEIARRVGKSISGPDSCAEGRGWQKGTGSDD